MIIYIFAGIGILLGIILLLLYNISSKRSVDLIKINEANDNVKILLEKKLDLIEKLHKSVNDKKTEKVLDKIPRIKKKDLDSYELDKELSKCFKEIKEIIDDDKKIILDDNDKEIIEEVNNIDIELKGVKTYYNNKVEEYNKNIKKISNLIIKIIKHHKEKELYSMKKELDFEILKS